MKTKIINILSHVPDYDFLKEDPRPPVNWDTPDGNWVGIYRNEIPNKLGREVLKHTDEFDYEVWQPDLRADKIYSHQFEDGLVHRLFPAEMASEVHGVKVRKEVASPTLTDFLKDFGSRHKVVINLNGDFKRISFDILEKCGHLPILQTFRGTLNLPRTMVFKKRLNVLASINYFRKHLKTKRLIKKVNYVSYQNELYLKSLRRIYKGPQAKLTSGCDFSFWKKLDKQECRKELGLPENKTIFFTSSLLIMRKQIDKLLEVMEDLDQEHDFLLIISGHGTNEYEKYLQDLAKPLMDKGKVKFVGYLTGHTLNKYYSASDLFINSSRSEGGPVSAMKAIACETPVFSTNIGNVAERMRVNRSGILVEIEDYQQWKNELKQVLNGKQVAPFNREEGERYYDWQKIAGRFSDIYRHIQPNGNGQDRPPGKNARRPKQKINSRETY